MTFWKIGEARISCRVTLEEIREMGFDYQELAQDRQKTVDFLGRILNDAKEALKVELPDGISAFTAHVLPDQSVLLVISCADIEKEIDRSLEVLGQRIEAMSELAADGKLNRVRGLSGQEKADAYNELMEEITQLLKETGAGEEESGEAPRDGVSVNVRRMDGDREVCRVLFRTLDDTIDFCSALEPSVLTSSRLYRHEDVYYLFADFDGEGADKNAEGFLSLADEFGGDTGDGGASEAFLIEHRLCMIPDRAVEKLGEIG